MGYVVPHKFAFLFAVLSFNFSVVDFLVAQMCNAAVDFSLLYDLFNIMTSLRFGSIASVMLDVIHLSNF